MATATSTDVLPAEEAAAIAALDEAKRQIDIARASEDVAALMEWRDRAAAVQHYIKKRDEARVLADNAGELKVRAEAALGKLDLAVSPGRGRRKQEEDKPAEAAPLAEFQPNTRSMFRTLGKLEESQLDAVVDKLRLEEDGGVTTARAVKEARSYIPVEERSVTEPTKEARKELVGDYTQHVRALSTEVSTLARLAKKVIPVATAGERNKIAERLSNIIAAAEDVRDALATGGASEVDDDGEDE